MTNETAQLLADMANKAETELLAACPPEMRDWYQSLPREKKVEMAMIAAVETAKRLSQAA